MTGYQPDFSLLKSLGVKFHDDPYKTPIYNETTMESSQKGVYLAWRCMWRIKNQQMVYRKFSCSCRYDHGSDNHLNQLG